jgi:hypothetical protein
MPSRTIWIDEKLYEKIKSAATKRKVSYKAQASYWVELGIYIGANRHLFLERKGTAKASKT